MQSVTPSLCVPVRSGYKLLSRKGDGTFSRVLKATSLATGRQVALKRMKHTFESGDEVERLREIQSLRKLSSHPNIVKLLEVLFDESRGKLTLVLELMDMNIYELIERNKRVPEEKLRGYLHQLLQAMDHMHKKGIFHRDIKPENLLIRGNVLKVADFGSSQLLNTKQPYTEYISTRWYRSPEGLLTDGFYDDKLDIWGIGCVIFEVISFFPLFPGSNEIDQVHKIHSVLGTPPSHIIERFKQHSRHVELHFPSRNGCGIAHMNKDLSPLCLDLISKLLEYDPAARITAKEALKHPFFSPLLSRSRLPAPDTRHSKDLPNSSRGPISHKEGRHAERAGEAPRQPSGQQKKRPSFAQEGTQNVGRQRRPLAYNARQSVERREKQPGGTAFPPLGKNKGQVSDAGDGPMVRPAPLRR